jgi:hypothetical protein
MREKYGPGGSVVRFHGDGPLLPLRTIIPSVPQPCAKPGRREHRARNQRGGSFSCEHVHTRPGEPRDRSELRNTVWS